MEKQSDHKDSCKNRIWFFAISLLCLIAAAFFAQARTERNYKATAAQHLTMVVDSVDFRSDLTRVYGKFVGRPHTSQRVEEMYLNVSEGKMQAFDIDGVDFKRWFQWEDDGVIPVEIDFPAMAPFESATLHISTHRGWDHCTISR